MTVREFKQRWVSSVNKMNRLGIPIPTIRDPQTGRGSITAALVVFSACLFGLCIVFMLASAIAKLTGFFVLTEATLSQVKTAADYSFQFLLAALGGYLGRKFQGEDTISSTLPLEPTKAALPTASVPKSRPVDDPDHQ